MPKKTPKTTSNNTYESALNISIDSPDLMNRTRYANLFDFSSNGSRTKVNSNLNIACIISDYLYRLLRHEAHLLLLTPDNWYFQIQYGNPDLLIVSSATTTATGHWALAQAGFTKETQIILRILDTTKKNKTPAIFWFTDKIESCSIPLEVLRRFDSIFCIDADDTNKLMQVGLDAHCLFPSIQPANSNPFLNDRLSIPIEIDFLFDGWYDIQPYSDSYQILKNKIMGEISVVETQHPILRSEVQNIERSQINFLGCISERHRSKIIKYANKCLTLQDNSGNSYSNQMFTLESAASRVPAVHYGRLEDTDIRKNIVFEKDVELKHNLQRLRVDDGFRKNWILKAWRHVLTNHCINHRLRSICDSVNVEYNYFGEPKITVLIGQSNYKSIQKMLEASKSQIYNKVNYLFIYTDKERVSTDSEYKENNIGMTCLNGNYNLCECVYAGIMQSKDDYCLISTDATYLNDKFRVFDVINYFKSNAADIYIDIRHSSNITVNRKNSELNKNYQKYSLMDQRSFLKNLDDIEVRAIFGDRTYFLECQNVIRYQDVSSFLYNSKRKNLRFGIIG